MRDGRQITYQAKGLSNQSPCSKELLNDKPTEDRLDLRDTTVLGVNGILLHKERSQICNKNLARTLSADKGSYGGIASWSYRKDDEKEVLDEPLSTRRGDTHSFTPRLPPITLGALIISIATEALVQVEMSTFGATGAEPQL